jgi:single-strand DNA-binding protein
MNNWNFTGNIGRDCETKHTPSGDIVVSFSVGVQCGYGEKKTTTWANCQMWGKRGEKVAPYLTKGQLVGVSGEVNMREWADKDGNKRHNLDVRVNDLTLLGRKDAQPRTEQTDTPKENKPPSGGNITDLDNDLPF